MPMPSIIKENKDKRKKQDLNIIAALTDLFKNFANPNGNYQGAMQNIVGQLIGFFVNMLGGVLAKLFGGSSEQFADLASSATGAFNRHMAQANEMEQTRQERLAQAQASNEYTPMYDTSMQNIADLDSNTNDLQNSVNNISNSDIIVDSTRNTNMTP